jgi:3-hydroxybutyryl-CoA dehydrogenase
MLIAVVANDLLKQELMAQGLRADATIAWIDQPIPIENVDAYIDLLFEPTTARIQSWNMASNIPVIVNAVQTASLLLPQNFIRINAWPGFLQRSITEAYAPTKHQQKAEAILAIFNKKIEWTPDVPGFIAARVISMIINEAYFTLSENVSTKEEIDIAMKLGTNYPMGPFEWSQQIGLHNIYTLLTELAKTNTRYQPAALLQTEAQQLS